MVTSPEMADELGVKCQCREEHDVVFGGHDVTTAAGQYTPQLARAIPRGLRRTLERRGPSRLRRLCYAVRAGLWQVESTRWYNVFVAADSPEDEEVDIYDGLVLEADRTPTPQEGIKFNLPSGIRKLVTEAVLSALRRLHINMGHPTNEDLKRCLRHAGCCELAQKAAGHLQRSTCARLARPRVSRPSRVPSAGMGFNELVWCDLYYLLDARRQKHWFVCLLDEATDYTVVVYTDGHQAAAAL